MMDYDKKSIKEYDKSCYIISSRNDNISYIKELLYSRRIAVMYPFPEVTISITMSYINSIKECDFVIFIANSNTGKSQMFELGIAVGLNKQIFMIVEDSYSISIPIHNFVYVRANINDIDAISYNFDHFLQYTKKKKYYNEIKKDRLIIDKDNQKDRIPVNDEINQSINDFRFYNLETEIREKTIIHTLKDMLLNSKGITVVSQNENINRGADLAIWIDEIGSVINGPILIELKRSVSTINDALKQMQSYLNKTNSPLGIVLFYEQSENYINNEIIVENSSHSVILAMSLGLFMNHVKNKSLAKYILDKRSRITQRGDSIV